MKKVDMSKCTTAYFHSFKTLFLKLNSTQKYLKVFICNKVRKAEKGQFFIIFFSCLCGRNSLEASGIETLPNGQLITDLS